jgi:hypothetical protein
VKKLIVRLLVAVVVLLLLAGVAVGLFLDSGIKRGVETPGPLLAKVPVKLESVSLSLFSGSGKIIKAPYRRSDQWFNGCGPACLYMLLRSKES